MNENIKEALRNTEVICASKEEQEFGDWATSCNLSYKFACGFHRGVLLGQKRGGCCGACEHYVVTASTFAKDMFGIKGNQVCTKLRVAVGFDGSEKQGWACDGKYFVWRED